MSDDLSAADPGTAPEPDSAPRNAPGPAGAALHEPVDLPLDMEAFYLSRHSYYYQYACARLGRGATAERLVREVFVHIGVEWEQILRAPNLQERTWQILRSAVDYYRGQAQDPLEAKLAVALATLTGIRESFATMQSTIGLYQALAEMTERQVDVLILRQVMGYDARDTAWILGVHLSTVDRTLKQARGRLEAALLPLRVLRSGDAIPAEGA
ncbi:RNA polymerase sigma factor [Streptacidiphilus sp. 4-A2]|nr:RNA polymerase sigma factor [Streptacidiphilus sp. 4-A2]